MFIKRKDGSYLFNSCSYSISKSKALSRIFSSSRAEYCSYHLSMSLLKSVSKSESNRIIG